MSVDVDKVNAHDFKISSSKIDIFSHFTRDYFN